MFLGGGAWDKSFLLTLYNGPKNFLHSTKKYSYDIPWPRLSILANSHPQTMEKLLNQEKLSAEAFLARWIMHVTKGERGRLGY